MLGVNWGTLKRDLTAIDCVPILQSFRTSSKLDRYEKNTTFSSGSDKNRLRKRVLAIHFFRNEAISDMHDGFIYYKDHIALSWFYCQANFNNCFFVPRREEKSE